MRLPSKRATFAGSNATRTASACPVRPEQTSSYVGFGVNPPAYPAAVEYTPGICQYNLSAPQKHPSANTAVSTPSGNGCSSGVPNTACRDGTSNTRCSRPGNASSAEIIFTSRLNSCMGYLRRFYDITSGNGLASPYRRGAEPSTEAMLAFRGQHYAGRDQRITSLGRRAVRRRAHPQPRAECPQLHRESHHLFDGPARPIRQ